MPNNENDFNLPKENNESPITDLPKLDEQSVEENKPTNNQPIIEIPQSYYDKLDQEKQAKMLTEQSSNQPLKDLPNDSEGMLTFIIINTIIIFGSFYFAINYSLYIALIIPIFLVILTIYNGISKKEKAIYPTSFLASGMVSAIISFIVSIFNSDTSETFIYFTMASAATGFIGYIISSIINKFVTKSKEMKALETLCYIVLLAAIVGLPTYYAIKEPESFYKLIFRTQVEVKAETEEEFVKKTIKARYNIEYTCNKINYAVNQDHRREIVREECHDKDSNEFIITSIAYDDGAVQYIVTDTYLDNLVINKVKENLIEKINNSLNLTDVKVSLYPESHCFFYGDCAPCDEYYENYQNENDYKKLYSVSSSINLEKEIKADPKDYINSNKYKYIISLYGDFASGNYNSAIETTINILNSNGYNNNYGFEIIIYNTKFSDNFKNKVYHIKGSATSDSKFGSFEEVPIVDSKK